MNEQLIIDLRLLNFDKLNELNEALAKSARLFDGSTRAVRTEGAAVLRTQKAVAQYERTVKGLIKDKEKLKLTDQQYNQGVEEALRLANLQIATDKDLIKLAKERNRKREEEQRAEEKLVRLYAPKTAAAREYQRVLEELEAALEANVITADDYAESLDRVEAEFKQFTAGAATGGNQFAKFNVEAYKAMQSTKRFASVGLQQAGYQIGDFIVQVQSGQSALVALGQQGSQLAGIFGPKGAIFGAVLAGVTALAMIFKESADAAKTSAEDMKSAFTDMGSFFNTVGVDIEMSFDKAFANIERRYGKFIAAISKDRVQAIKDALKAGAEATEDAGKVGLAERVFSSIGMGALGQSPGGAAMVEAELKRLEESKQQNKEANTLVESFKEQVAALNSMDEISKAVLETFIALGEVSEEAQKAFKQQMTDLGLDDVIADYEITIYERMIAAFERAYEFEKGLLKKRQSDQKQISNDAIDAAVAIYEKRKALEEKNRQLMLDTYDKAATQQMILGQSPIFMNMEMLADAGKTYEENLKKAKKELDLMLDRYEKAARIEVQLGKNPYAINMDSIEGAVEIFKDGQKKNKGGRKTKTPAQQLSEYLTNLRSEAQLEKDLVGISGQRREIAEELLKLKLKYVDLITPQVKQEVTNQIKLKDAAEQAHQQRMDQLQQQADMFNFLGKSYGDFLYDVLAGNESTAKSFENMANKVIAHLFDVLVMQQMIGTMGTADSPGTGLLGMLSFDGGGYTGRGARSGGLDGKGGFMAMLHPNETVIDHTKGQGGGVVVQQTFNFSANGDESVKRIISQEAPKIANMTSASIMDQRRRGGAMRKSFT